MIAPAYVVQLSDAGDPVVLGIGGDVDRESRHLIEGVIVAAIGSAPTLVLDLGEVTFCDSAGIGMFITVQAKAREEGTELALQNVGPQVRRMFEVANITSLLCSYAPKALDRHSKREATPGT